ncbi:MAG: hypothetical protein RQ729_09215 [Wenzhouxiangellaceae bacterium]|nr:hypothetical protein [Wenzhouxiangellaceae bacterium]
MAKQLLITLLVAAIVVLIARMKRGRAAVDAAGGPHSDGDDGDGGLSTVALAGYVLAGLMIITAGTLGYLGWRENNEIIEVVVIDSGTSDRTVYQVRRKALGNREFETVDGRFVSLGASDRMERVD